MKLSSTPAVLLAVLASAVVLAACGSSTSSSSSASAAGAAGTAGAARGNFAARRTKLVACLKQHGVTLPSRPPGAAGGGGYGGPPPGATGGAPSGRPGGTGGFFGGGGRLSANPKLRAAFQACGGSFGGRFRGAPRQAAVKRFVTCVNQHGYKLPQPNFSGSGPIFPARIESNAKFQKASRACQSLLAPRAPAGSGPPPSA